MFTFWQTYTYFNVFAKKSQQKKRIKRIDRGDCIPAGLLGRQNAGATCVNGESISIGGGFWLTEVGQKCILIGRPVGLLGVCGLDGVVKVYSVSSAKYRVFTAVRTVCAVKYKPYVERRKR
jgi:hypothetical protein